MRHPIFEMFSLKKLEIITVQVIIRKDSDSIKLVKQNFDILISGGKEFYDSF